MTTLEAIGLSTIGGIVASLIVLFLTHYWNKIIVPWYEDRVYKGNRIDGQWKTEMNCDGVISNEIVILRQHGHAIEGKITFPHDAEGRSHMYDAEGQFINGTLSLMMHEVGQGCHDIGAIVLEFVPGGSQPKMIGKGIWPEEGKIVSIDYTWIKE